MKITISGNPGVFAEMIELARRLLSVEELDTKLWLACSFPRSAHKLSDELESIKEVMLSFIDESDLFILHNKVVEDNKTKKGFIDGDNLDYLARAVERELPIIYTHEASTPHLKPPSDYKYETPVIERSEIPAQIEKLKYRQFDLEDLLEPTK